MKLMLIDGNSIVNRAFYGIRMLTTHDGTPTNGVYGFLTMLRRLVSDEQPDGICVAFDLKAPTFRHLQYEGYKAQRKGMPDELAVQIPILKEVLDAMNICRCEKEGWEADDIIGTMAKKAEEEGNTCVIVTGDKDSFQLITDKTFVRHVKTRMGQTETKLYTKESFFEEYGFTPKQIIDLKALMGDSSDNIPGVSGIGEKTATDLICRYETVEKIYSDLGALDIKASVLKKLEAGRESAFMSYDLATIRTEAPIETKPSDTAVKEPDNDKLYEIFRKLEFTKLITEMGLHSKEEKAPEEYTGECESVNVISEKDAQEMFSDLCGKDIVNFRCTDDFSMTVLEADGKAYIIEKDAAGNWNGIMTRVFSGDVKKAGHGVKDTMRKALANGFKTDGFVFDTEIAAYLLASTDNSYELSRLTELYLGFTLKTTDDSGQLSLLSSGEDILRLTVEAAAIGALHEYFAPELERLGLDFLMYSVELPLCAVLAHMEQTGFLVDKNALSDFGKMLGDHIANMEGEIYALAGCEFNINSPKQLGQVLFEELMLPAPKKTKTGYSTNVDVLEKLRDKHEIIPKILEYRTYTKLRSTYAEGLYKVIENDGRIRTKFQMTVTATGRLSSTEPNLQNIPVRTELGGEIRKMFIAPEGSVLVDADYSQVELRLLAEISGDESMKKAFLTGEDIHTITASQVFGTAPEDVLPIQRARAKAVNFGIVYGISAFSLSQDIGVTVSEAKEYMQTYLSKFSGVSGYMKAIVEKAKADGCVTTLYGRRRDLPELKSSNFNIRSFGERVALNMPIQGTAADIMKIAMVNTHRRLKEERLEAKMILQVHDELIVECPEHEAEKVSQILKEEMENAAKLSLPLEASTGVGKSWYDAK